MYSHTMPKPDFTLHRANGRWHIGETELFLFKNKNGKWRVNSGSWARRNNLAGVSFTTRREALQAVTAIMQVDPPFVYAYEPDNVTRLDNDTWISSDRNFIVRRMVNSAGKTFYRLQSVSNPIDTWAEHPTLRGARCDIADCLFRSSARIDPFVKAD